MFARVLVSFPRMGQCSSQGFGCGHLPVSSTHGCAAAALPLLTKPIEVPTHGRLLIKENHWSCYKFLAMRPSNT